MKMKRFEVVYTVRAMVEISEEVLALHADTERFRGCPSPRRQAVAKHIAYNLIKNGITLDQIDGLADRSADEARVEPRVDWEFETLREVKKR